MAQYHRPALSLEGLFIDERSTQQGAGAQQTEQIAGDQQALQATRLAALREKQVDVALALLIGPDIRGHATEHAVAFLPVREVGGRRGSVGPPLQGIRFPDLHHAIGFGNRQGPPQHCVRDIEHGRVCANADRQRDDGDQGKPGRSTQIPNRISQISKKRSHATLDVADRLRLGGIRERSRIEKRDGFAYQAVANREHLEYRDDAHHQVRVPESRDMLAFADHAMYAQVAKERSHAANKREGKGV